MKKCVAGMTRPWRREGWRGAIFPVQLEPWPLFSGAEMQAPEPSAGESLLWLWGSDGFSALSKSKWTLFPSSLREARKRSLFYSEGGLPGSGISKWSTAASASVVLIQVRQVGVYQGDPSALQWLWELTGDSCWIPLDKYFIGLQKSLPWVLDYMWCSFIYVYSKFPTMLIRQNCPGVKYYSYIKIHIQK